MGGKRILRKRKKKISLGRLFLSNGVAALAAVFLLLLFRPVSEATERSSFNSMFIPPASTPHDPLLSGQRILLDAEAPSAIPDNALPVLSITIDQGKTDAGVAGARVNNTTKFKPNYEALFKKKNPLPPKKKGVQVLILHSHGTEGYTDSNAAYYLPAQEPRSQDLTQNVVAVGTVLAAKLEEQGISTLHLTDLCDVPSFNASYTNSLQLAEQALEAHPSIRVIIDLHRDSMITESGTKYRPVTDVGGRNAAQMMLVVGTSQNGKAHKDWQNNLTFALQLQNKLSSKYPGLMRPINLRSDRFNQHLRTGAFLLELGSCGNSLEEARYSAELLGGTLAALLKAGS